MVHDKRSVGPTPLFFGMYFARYKDDGRNSIDGLTICRAKIGKMAASVQLEHWENGGKCMARTRVNIHLYVGP